MNGLTPLESFLKLQIVSLIADILSISGFVLTVWVLLETRKLRSLYVLKARGPSLIRDLQKLVTKLSGYLNNYPNSVAKIAQELGKIQIKFKSLEAKLGGT